MSAYELQVFIGNVHFDATEQELGDLVRSAGYRVSESPIARREDGITSKGFGFVTMLTDQSEDEVIAALYGLVLRGRGIRAERVKPKNQRAA